jgi:hypothetical protein
VRACARTGWCWLPTGPSHLSIHPLLTTPLTQVESLEKERDFYFGKLRDVEILLQSYSGPDRPTVDALFKILYLADDEFVSVAGEEAKTEGEGQ